MARTTKDLHFRPHSASPQDVGRRLCTHAVFVPQGFGGTTGSPHSALHPGLSVNKQRRRPRAEACAVVSRVTGESAGQEWDSGYQYSVPFGSRACLNGYYRDNRALTFLGIYFFVCKMNNI